MSAVEASPSQRRRLKYLERIRDERGSRAIDARMLGPAGDVVVASYLVGAEGRAELVGLEVLDRLGRPYRDDVAEELLGRARDRALREAERATADLVALVAVQQRSGKRVNMAAAARRAGIGRNTLYTRLADHGVAP